MRQGGVSCAKQSCPIDLVSLGWPGMETFRSAALKRGVGRDEILVTPDLPLDVAKLDCLKLRYAVSYGLGRWTPHLGWASTSDWIDRTSELWQDKIKKFEEKAGNWMRAQECGIQCVATQSLQRLYDYIIHRSVQRELILKRQQDHRDAVVERSGSAKRLERTDASRNRPRPKLRRASAVHSTGVMPESTSIKSDSDTEDSRRSNASWPRGRRSLRKLRGALQSAAKRMSRRRSVDSDSSDDVSHFSTSFSARCDRMVIEDCCQAPASSMRSLSMVGNSLAQKPPLRLHPIQSASSGSDVDRLSMLLSKSALGKPPLPVPRKSASPMIGPSMRDLYTDVQLFGSSKASLDLSTLGRRTWSPLPGLAGSRPASSAVMGTVSGSRVGEHT